jgi:hypothetical protein
MRLPTSSPRALLQLVGGLFAISGQADDDLRRDQAAAAPGRSVA